MACATSLLCASVALSQSLPARLALIETAPVESRGPRADSLLRVFPFNPIVEGDSLAYLLYRGKGNRVAVAGDFNGWSNAVTTMRCVQGTDLWHTEVRLPPDSRVDFKLVLDDSLWILDPRAPHTSPTAWGPNSELRMPLYRFPSELEEHAGVPRGKILDTVVAGSTAGDARAVRVYLPAGYSVTSPPYPLIVVHDGLDYLSHARMARVLDNLIFEGAVPPLIAVFVPPGKRSEEYAGARMDSFTVFVVRDLLSWIDRRFHTDERPRRRAVLGASDGGNIALYQAVRYPGAFGLVAAQSSNVLPEVEEEYRSAGSLPGKIYLDIGVFDIPVLVPRVRNLKATLESRGGTVCFVELHDGHSWGSWRSRLRELLVFLFTQS